MPLNRGFWFGTCCTSPPTIPSSMYPEPKHAKSNMSKIVLVVPVNPIGVVLVVLLCRRFLPVVDLIVVRRNRSSRILRCGFPTPQVITGPVVSDPQSAILRPAFQVLHQDLRCNAEPLVHRIVDADSRCHKIPPLPPEMSKRARASRDRRPRAELVSVGLIY